MDVATADTITEAIYAIEDAIRECSGREIVATTGMVDRLLDIRSMLESIREPEDV